MLSVNALFNYISARCDRFKAGQILFITAITFGLFFDDTVRKILFFGALFCLSKDQFKNMSLYSWNSLTKVYAVLVVLFWGLMLFIPLLFGVDCFSERLVSIGWPLEIFLWMWLTLFFAKDEFFVKTLSTFSILAVACYCLLALNHIYATKLVIDYNYYYHWPLHLNSWIAGSLISALMPWLLYKFWKSSRLASFICCFILFILSSVVLIATAYTTFWLILCCEFAGSAILMLFDKSSKKTMLAWKFALCSCTAIIALAAVVSFSPKAADMLREQCSQLAAFDSDITVFTSERDLVWKEAVQLIRRRPIIGYGWADYEKFSAIGKGHSHSALLQIVWTAGILPGVVFLLILGTAAFLCLYNLYRYKNVKPLCFTVALVLMVFTVNGILDNDFKTTRKVAMVYWICLAMPLTTIFREQFRINEHSDS